MSIRIVQIISEHKKIILNPPSDSYRRPQPLKKGYKRVEAIVETKYDRFTKHIDIPKERGGIR